MKQGTVHHFKDWSGNYLYENRYSKKILFYVYIKLNIQEN